MQFDWYKISGVKFPYSLSGRRYGTFFLRSPFFADQGPRAGAITFKLQKWLLQ